MKLRGLRIELGEIEAALNQHPRLSEAAILVREDQPPKKILTAYFVPMEAPGPSAGELREFMGERLPAYMVPAAFVALEKLPLTPNGKVDRRALPAPPVAAEESYVAPSSDAERVLARVWCEVLGHGRIGVHDNFFELGGDSILGIQIVSHAAQEGLRLTPRQLFEHPSLAELAEVAERVETGRAAAGPVRGPVPLTAIQRRFFEQGVERLEHFNQAVLLGLPPAVDGGFLHRAVAHLLVHHDALRMRFVAPSPGENEWRQVNDGVALESPPQSRVTAEVDLAALAADRRRAALEAAAAAAQASLDLAAGALLRVVLFDLGEGRGQTPPLDRPPPGDRRHLLARAPRRPGNARGAARAREDRGPAAQDDLVP